MTHIFLLLEKNVFRAQIKIKSFAKPISHQLINMQKVYVDVFQLILIVIQQSY